MHKIKTPSVRNIIYPLLTMLLWGSLFPCIKIGYKAFNIQTNSVAEILMFAALRFVVCGFIMCGIACVLKLKIASPKRKNIRSICFMGFFAIVLHYGFTYVGLTTVDSSKTAILKQTAPLLFACFSFLFIKKETFSITKIIGAIVGFCGILAINAGASFSSFSVGDAFIILASLCTVISMIISERFAKNNSPFWLTGISQLFGGVVLLVTAWAMGGKFPVFTFQATLIFIYICAASIIGYTLFYYVQRSAELSKLFIIKFAEPLFACIFSAILLGENIFKIQYLAAFFLISVGIVLGNFKYKKGCKKHDEVP